MPCGPPSGLYTGRMADPTGSLSRVDTDENEGRAATRAKNLAQAALEVTEQPGIEDPSDVWVGVVTGVLVKSTPRTMASARAEVASVLRYSSTTKTPAMSPLK